MNKMSLYNELPICFQNWACSLEGKRLQRLRYGGSFEQYLERYLHNRPLSGEEIVSIRNEKLQKIVRFAYENTAFYRDRFDQAGVDPYAVRSEDDIATLPILTKMEVREHAGEIAPGPAVALGAYVSEHTSGSTGTSLRFNQSVDNIRDLWAVFWRFWIELGITRETGCADFGSRAIVPSSQTKPPFWRDCPPLHQTKFSAFHGNDHNYASYAKKIDEEGLQWIHGYPSCIVPFAAFVLNNDIEFRLPIKWVTTSAENLYDYQRNLIKKAFGVEPYSLYALTEATACISENRAHQQVIDEDYSLVELIKAGDGYRIVGTNLTNYAFPLLRYDTGDICTYSGSHTDGWRIVDFIDGRSAELVRLPDGGTVGALSALFTESSTIKEAQIVQHPDYSVTISFVPAEEGYQKDVEIAHDKFVERTRGQLVVEFKQVERLPRTSRGKLRYVVSEME